jgi:hypothetical protein
VALEPRNSGGADCRCTIDLIRRSWTCWGVRWLGKQLVVFCATQSAVEMTACLQLLPPVVKTEKSRSACAPLDRVTTLRKFLDRLKDISRPVNYSFLEL